MSVTDQRTWSIGALAKEAGVTKRALHHYDEIGLLVPAERTATGYRRYCESDAQRLAQINRLRGLGLSLEEVRQVLDGVGGDIVPLLDGLRDRIDRQLAFEQRRRDRLAQLLDSLRTAARPSLDDIIDTLEEAAQMPTGAQRTIAVLAYADLEAAHDYLVDVFSLQAGGVHRDADGRAVHGEVHAADGSAIWLHRVAPEHGLASPAEVERATGGVVVIVDDVDAHHEHAASAGARIDYTPTDQPYGLREYAARDLEGGRWYFAAPLADESQTAAG